MINTQTQIDSLIDLAVIQRTELKQLIDSLPQLRDHLSSEIERNLEEIEPAIRSELEQFVAARALDTQAKTSAELSAKLDAMARNLESTTAAKYSVLMAERAENANLLAKAEARIEDAASMLSHAVKEIVTDELSRFPRAGEIDQLRKEFAEPRGLNPRGRWQVGETYNKLDLVSYNGDSYVSSTDGNREKPSRSSEAWTLSAARGNGGGGGVTSMTDLVPVPSNGEILIGNGSAFVNATLTAGTGISISNGPGSITINATDGNITLDDGTAAAPSLNFTSDTNTGLYRPAADTVGIVGGGHDIVRLTDVASATDYLEIKNAIGVSTPLHVLASGSSTNIGLHLQPKGSGLITISDGTDFNKGIRFRCSSSAASAITLLDAVSTAGRVITLPDATDTLVGKATTDTLTNKTLTTPTIDTITAPAATNLTLAGGSTGASLVLGQGASGVATFAGAASINGGTLFADTKLVVRAVSDGNVHFRNAAAFSVYSGAGLDFFNNAGDTLTNATFRASAYNFSSNGIVRVLNTTAASSTGSGALQVAGGVGVAGAGYFGGVLNVAGDASFSSGTFSLTGGAGSYGLTISNTSTTTRLTTSFGGSSLGFRVNAAGSDQLTVSGSAVNVPLATASTGVGTGALQVAGGIYAGAASVFGSTVDIKGSLLDISSGLSQFSIIATGSNAIANGGTFQLGGVYTGTTTTTFAGLRGEKENGTDGNTAGALTFWTRPNGGAMAKRFTIGSTGDIATTGAATFAGAVTTSSATLSGAGAIPITTSLVKFTSTGAANALTLANGVDGQRLTIVHDVKGTLGTGVLTPTTKTGFTTVTFTNAGDTVSLVYVTTRGWMVTGSYLATIA